MVNGEWWGGVEVTLAQKWRVLGILVVVRCSNYIKNINTIIYIITILSRL